MPRKHSVTRADFSRLAASPLRKGHGTLFSLSYAPLPAGESSRATCVVSKKVSQKAVERNAIKRKCRAALFSVLASQKQPYTFIFFAKKAAAAASFEEIQKDVLSLIEKNRGTMVRK